MSLRNLHLQSVQHLVRKPLNKRRLDKQNKQRTVNSCTICALNQSDGVWNEGVPGPYKGMKPGCASSTRSCEPFLAIRAHIVIKVWGSGINLVRPLVKEWGWVVEKAIFIWGSWLKKKKKRLLTEHFLSPCLLFLKNNSSTARKTSSFPDSRNPTVCTTWALSTSSVSSQGSFSEGDPRQSGPFKSVFVPTAVNPPRSTPGPGTSGQGSLRKVRSSMRKSKYWPRGTSLELMMAVPTGTHWKFVTRTMCLFWT